MPPTLPTGTNAHIVLLGKENIEVQYRPIPAVTGDQVLVKMMATGLCGTDVSFYTRGGIGSRVVSKPLVLGHEGAGVIRAVGSDVTKVAVGDHVAIEPALPCRTCRFCLSGQWNYCERDEYFATPGTDGTLCQYFACPETSCVRIPPDLPWPQAGCIQPLAIAIQIARRAPKLAHAAVGVMGCGPLGLLCMAVARAYAAREIVAVDRVRQRVDFALKYAATHAELNPEKNMKAATNGTHVVKGRGSKLREVGDELAWLDDWVEEHLPLWGVEHGLDIVIDATGAEPCMQLAVALLRPGGTLILAGMGPPLTRFPTLEVASKELNIIGSLRYTTRCFEDGIHLVERGLVDLGPLVTKTVPLCKAEEAFKAARDGPVAGVEMKVVVMNQE
ncbi:hypothetical protein CspeluHIS016_0108700 [Cutaneotrichosporon spelunceum]|uniref:Enoyl reductase (ER) domain-containing protein n=1 Tax=Cutaneotrichosporon spelunceum TaxID=1672016 RepID=A0AAD3TPG5_9TREE|nr:hypothetical protein CspeluHIS016_0108700 [Cutaneotrichosporon spelunceum]